MISALAWVRQGAAKPLPKKYDLDEEEYARVTQQLSNARADLSSAQAASAASAGPDAAGADTKMEEGDPDLAEFDLDNYDAPADAADDEAAPADDEGDVALFGNLKGLTYHAANTEDPYITLQDEEDGETQEEESNDLRILPTDNLILSARTEDDISHVEVYVYEAAEENLYIHHDLMIPAFPLCVEWLSHTPGSSANGTGNYVAIGTFDPEIEIWDLDVIDAMYPVAILGDGARKPTGKKKRNAKHLSDTHHTDAVMSLAWNTHHPHLLASSSADASVKLWDLNTTKCAHSFNHHADKVQAVAWNPAETSILLTASYDRTAQVLDSRVPDATPTSFALPSDPESARWDPHNPAHFYIATEAGQVLAWDVRSPAQPLWTLHAHDSAVSAMDVNSRIPGCLVTGGVDKLVKVWDISSGKPSMVLSRDLGAGKVFTTAFCPDAPQHLAIAGSQGRLNVWDMSGNPGARRAFANRVVWDDSVTADKAPVEIADADQDEDSEDDDAGAAEGFGVPENIDEDDEDDSGDDV